MGVALRVVLHGMTAPDDLGAQVPILQGPVTDAEEGRASPAGVQQVEHAGCDFGVRSVVDGDRDLPALRRRGGQAQEVRA